MLIYHKGHTDAIQVYSVTVMTHVKALQAGHSSQGTSEPITPAQPLDHTQYLTCTLVCGSHVSSICYVTHVAYKIYETDFNPTRPRIISTMLKVCVILY